MATSVARRNGFRVDEQIAAKQVRANISFLAAMRERLRQGVMLVQVNDNFGSVIMGYLLVGLDAEHYKSDVNTDAVAMYMKMHQMTDGHWEIGRHSGRPPLGSDYIGQTVLAMRALQLYAPKTDKPAYDKAVQRASNWLLKAESMNNDDRGWRLMGLTWAGADKAVTQKALRELLSIPNADGGWSDLPSLGSTGYATGKMLVAAHCRVARIRPGLSTRRPVLIEFSRRTARGTSSLARWDSSHTSMPASLTITTSGFQRQVQTGPRWL